ncbi:nucleolar protein 8 isoform X2 [Nematostella vectensis]|uniref:nucleolar protein 8 isoform X2 n=1 Tax=Nematostella vectensis TaxID=45351 RepID=UPI0013904275|nr:nucleolar protein 8 isoform X2 [Nematostella vectensis]
MSSQVKTRLFIGGLYHEIKERDISERLKNFGSVSSVEIHRKDGLPGFPGKTFAYVDISAPEASIRKCISVLTNTNWKGSQIKVQQAKESFLSRLEKERKAATSSKTTSKSLTSPALSEELVEPIKHAVPGSQVPGKKDWVVGKFGRALPILRMRQRGSAKIARFDPSKTVHNLKKFREEVTEEASCEQLTWDLRDENQASSKEVRTSRKSANNSSQKKMDRSGSGDSLEPFPTKNGHASPREQVKVGNAMLRCGKEKSQSRDLGLQDNLLNRSSALDEAKHRDKDAVRRKKRVSDVSDPKSKGANVKPRKSSLNKMENRTKTEEFTEPKARSKKKNQTKQKLGFNDESSPAKRSMVGESKEDCSDGESKDHYSDGESEQDSSDGESEEVSSDNESSSDLLMSFLTKSADKSSVDFNSDIGIDESDDRSSPGQISDSDSPCKRTKSSSQNLKGTKSIEKKCDSHDSRKKGVSYLGASGGRGGLGKFEDEVAMTKGKVKRQDKGNKEITDCADVKYGFTAKGQVAKDLKLGKRRRERRGEESMDEDSCEETDTNETRESTKKMKESMTASPDGLPDSPKEKMCDGRNNRKKKESLKESGSDDAGKGKEKVNHEKSSNGNLNDKETTIRENKEDANFLDVVTDKYTAKSTMKKGVKSDKNVEKDPPIEEQKYIKAHSIGDNTGTTKKSNGHGAAESPLGCSKHLDSNARRLSAIKEREKAAASQKQLIASALTAVDGGKASDDGRRIVFDSDDEADNRTRQKKSPSESKISGKEARDWLGFDSGSSSAESDATSGDDDDVGFAPKPQFEGKSGEKLFKLQASFKGDRRFQLDKRFIDSDGEDQEEEKIDVIDSSSRCLDNTDDDVTMQLAREKDMSMAVLQKMLGGSLVASLHQNTAHIEVFRDSTKMRYDPSREDHEDYEQIVNKTPKQTSKEPEPEVSPKSESAEALKVTSAPEVTKDTFYDVNTTSLAEMFGSKKEESSASFLFLGNTTGSDEESPAKDIGEMEVLHKVGWHQEKLPYDSSSDDEEEEKEEEKDLKQETADGELFFFQQNDPRLGDETTFTRHASLEEITNRWVRMRRDLTQDYKKKHKDAVRRKTKMESKRAQQK